MLKYLNQYEKEIGEKLKNGLVSENPQAVLENHRQQIEFFQHERLIHLLVTLAFGIGNLMALMMVLFFSSLLLAALDSILLVMFIAYVVHYFKLENGVQRLYEIDKGINKKINK